jgi:hypothetical protein
LGSKLLLAKSHSCVLGLTGSRSPPPGSSSYDAGVVEGFPLGAQSWACCVATCAHLYQGVQPSGTGTGPVSVQLEA